MRQAKKKPATGSAGSAKNTTAPATHMPNEAFDAFLLRTNAPLVQTALRRGMRNAALHIFHSEAMYGKVIQQQQMFYAVMEQEQAANAATLASFRATMLSRSDFSSYLQQRKTS